MPIDATCPHCQKRYRLKDELAGKTVKCSAAECRKSFAVSTTVTANGKPAPAAKKPAAAPLDAEAIAAQLFADEPDQKPAAERQIDVVCEVCEHKWTEPASKIGKIVLCPDCKHRQKIPEPKTKKMDWRDATKEGRKGPELPADLEAQRLSTVDVQSLKQAGAIEEDAVEPRTAGEWARLIALIAVPVLLLAGGGWWFYQSRTDSKHLLYIATAVDEAKAIPDDGQFPKGEPPLLRAALYLAAAEYHLRRDSEEGRTEAFVQYGNARRELDNAQPSLTRDVLYGELAVALLALGGDAEQVKGRTRIAWTPQSASNAQPGMGQARFVQVELRQLLTDMQVRIPAEMRQYIVRRLARELAKRGQFDLLPEIARQGFSAEDLPEAQAQMYLEAAKAGWPTDKLKPQVDQIVLGEQPNLVPTAVALFKKLGIPTEGKKVLPPPVQGDTDLLKLAAYGTAAAAEGKPQDALSIVGPGGQTPQVLSWLADAAPDPTPILDVAVTQAQQNPNAMDRSKAFYLYRLVRAACDANQPAKAEALAKVIQDDGLKEWATAEALRAKWAAAKAAPPAAEAPKPANTAAARVGNALGCLWFARLTALNGGGSTKDYDAWGELGLKGFGYAGHALGLQDRK
jgi:hypothetical protein